MYWFQNRQSKEFQAAVFNGQELATTSSRCSCEVLMLGPATDSQQNKIQTTIVRGLSTVKGKRVFDQIPLLRSFFKTSLKSVNVNNIDSSKTFAKRSQIVRGLSTVKGKRVFDQIPPLASFFKTVISNYYQQDWLIRNFRKSEARSSQSPEIVDWQNPISQSSIQLTGVGHTDAHTAGQKKEGERGRENFIGQALAADSASTLSRFLSPGQKQSVAFPRSSGTTELGPWRGGGKRWGEGDRADTCALHEPVSDSRGNRVNLRRVSVTVPFHMTSCWARCVCQHNEVNKQVDFKQITATPNTWTSIMLQISLWTKYRHCVP